MRFTTVLLMTLTIGLTAATFAKNASAFGGGHRSTPPSSGGSSGGAPSSGGSSNGGGGAPEPAAILLLAAGGTVAGLKSLKRRLANRATNKDA
jgi:hypothetical protein